MPAADVIPVTPNGAKSEQVVGVPALIPITMNSTRTPILISTMIALVLADSLAPRISSRVHRTTRMTAGRLRTPPCSGAWDRRLGDREAEEVVEELVEVLRPADGDGGSGHAVLQQQAGGDADRGQLAQRRVRVGVRRSRDRDRAGQLGVADRRSARRPCRRSRTTRSPRARRPGPPEPARRRCRCRWWRRCRTSRAGTARSCERARSCRCRRRSPAAISGTGLRRNSCCAKGAMVPSQATEARPGARRPRPLRSLALRRRAWE